MARCVHLYESGGRCRSEALAGGDFCEDHDGGEVIFEKLHDHPLRKLLLRLVALILLIIFLVPFYLSLKSLYTAPPTQVQEAW